MNIENLFKYLLLPVASLIVALVLKNSAFDESTERIENDDFVIVESEISFDSLTLNKIFFIKNNTNFPINSDNVIISYTSDVAPVGANFSSASCDFMPISFSQKSKALFNCPLPSELRNQEYFNIVIKYPYYKTFRDNLRITIESKRDDKFIKLENNGQSVNTLIENTKSAFYWGKTIIIVETAVLLYILSLVVMRFGKWIYQKYKEDQDLKFFGKKNKKQFITK